MGVVAHLFLSSGVMVARDSLTVGGMNTSHSAVVKGCELFISDHVMEFVYLKFK